MASSSESTASQDKRTYQNTKEEKHLRVRTAPPTQTDPDSKPAPRFVLQNMDGTIIQPYADSDANETSDYWKSIRTDAATMEQEVDMILNGPSLPQDSLPNTPDEIKMQETQHEEIYSSEEEVLSTSTAAVKEIPSSESSGRSIEPTEFEKFMQIEKLIREFPAPDDDVLKKQVKRFLAIKERTPVPTNFIFARDDSVLAEKLQALKKKGHSVIEKVRNEFNRVTVSNKEEVIKKIKSIKVKTVSEMREIVSFILEKAISEELYRKVYASIVGALKSNWKCEEEESMEGKKQTCFFGTLLRFMSVRVSSKQDWAEGKDEPEDNLEGVNEIKAERNKEDRETTRLKKKKMALGIVDFISELYLQNVIGPTNMVLVSESLRSLNLAENVEMCCVLLKKVGEKFIENDKTSVVMDLQSFLTSHLKKFGPRMDFMIESTVKAISPYLIGRMKNGTTGAKNIFAGLAIEEPQIPEKKGEEELAQDLVFAVASKVKEECDRKEVVDEITGFLKEHSKEEVNRSFFTAYIIEMVTNHKAMVPMRELLFEELHKYANSLFNSISDVKNEYAMLRIDFPRVPRYFSELLSLLRGAEFISVDEFNKLKPQEFPKLASILMKEWQDSSDPRLSKVFSQDDLKILQ